MSINNFGVGKMEIMFSVVGFMMLILIIWDQEGQHGFVFNWVIIYHESINVSIKTLCHHKESYFEKDLCIVLFMYIFVLQFCKAHTIILQE